jgi:CheY-like chemotaxis protein
MDETRRPVDVLIVDDVVENRLQLETLLTSADRNFLLAGTGEEALELIADHDFAVVLLDVHLPGMSGFDVAERMRAEPRTVHVPILFISAVKQQPHHVFVGYELGAVDYVLRPFDAHILRSKIAILCDLWVQRHLIEEQNALLQKQMGEIKTLRGLIAVCAVCHRIRDDQGLWERCMIYVARHTEAEFTHAICESCQKEVYPDL